MTEILLKPCKTPFKQPTIMDLLSRDDLHSKFASWKCIINRGYLFLSVKDRNLFHRVDTIGNIFTSGVLFPVVPLPHGNILQYYVKRKKCKVNDVIFPSGCEARAINLGNKNMKIGIFTSGTSVRSKNIFTDISRYPTGKHEITPFICPTKF